VEKHISNGLSRFSIRMYNCFYVLGRYYKSGVLSDPRCSKRHANHAMLVVGYGTHKGRKYWLLKNRWVLLELTTLRVFATLALR